MSAFPARLCHEKASSRLRVGQRGVGARRRAFLENQEEVGEIDPAQQQTDGGHDHVGHQGLDDGAECRADDDTDSHVEHIALHRKFSKFLNHMRLLIHKFIIYIA